MGLPIAALDPSLRKREILVDLKEVGQSNWVGVFALPSRVVDRTSKKSQLDAVAC